MSDHSSISSPTRTTEPAAIKEVIADREPLQTEFDALPLHAMSMQFKLSVGAPDDPLEREADAMADKIMRMPFSSLPYAHSVRNGTEALQRKCSECESSSVEPVEEKEKVQRKPLVSFIQRQESPGAAAASDALSNQINTSRGSGDNLDRYTQSFMESRFDTDFSNVKIHTGDDAAQMSQELNAQAFTVGNDIYFNSGKYNPSSDSGKHLLAHELTHVIQRGDDHIKRQTVSAALPQVSQGQLDICGAASLITALMIWDNENPSPTEPNSRFVAATNIVLTYFSQRQTSVMTGLQTRVHLTATDADTLYWSMRRGLASLISLARTPGHVVNETEYHVLATAIYALYVDTRAGLSASDISNIQTMLGLDTSRSSSGIMSFTQLIGDSILTGLLPGQIAQLGWYVRTGGTALGLHAFIIGRLANGDWYLHDQGPSPPVRMQALTLGGLISQITTEAAAGRYWLFTGTPAMVAVGGWTGIRLLSTNDRSVIATSTALIPSGTYLAEADDGYFTSGDPINSGSFVSEHYSITDAQAAAIGVTSGGAVIVEMPTGRFVVFQTNMVRDPNRSVPAIDASGGGLLAGTHTFFHAWLQLRSPAGVGSFISVY